MSELFPQLEVDKYVYLKEFLSLENCEELTKELHQLVEDKLTYTDDQCPLSHSIYGGKKFDALLNGLLPYFESATGKQLYPTYSYARLYKPGEILEVHTDRESCEISATITLGFEGEGWPLYMGDDMDKSNPSIVHMDVGDAILYYGGIKHHWREEYNQGKWQAQVFLHYVDANGPYKDWKFDNKNKRLTNQPVVPSVNEESELLYRYFEDVLSHEECNNLVTTFTTGEFVKELPYIGGVDDDKEGVVDTSIRNVERIILPTYKGLGASLAAVGLSANFFNWKYDITHANQSEFLIYPSGGRYKTHMDLFMTGGSATRKLTVIAFLNDDFKGGKFFIQSGYDKVYPKQSKGTIVVFPSFLLHGVEDIEEGTRYSAVCWMVGESFR